MFSLISLYLAVRRAGTMTAAVEVAAQAQRAAANEQVELRLAA